jgi:hypothetical protein
VPVVIAAISIAKSALRKLSAAAPYEISAAHWADSASANARLRTAEPTSSAAEAHTPSRAADVHPSRGAADTHAAAANVHATAGHATSAAVHAATSAVHATATAAALLGEDRGCNR